MLKDIECWWCRTIRLSISQTFYTQLARVSGTKLFTSKKFETWYWCYYVVRKFDYFQPKYQFPKKGNKCSQQAEITSHTICYISYVAYLNKVIPNRPSKLSKQNTHHRPQHCHSWINCNTIKLILFRFERSYWYLKIHNACLVRQHAWVLWFGMNNQEFNEFYAGVLSFNASYVLKPRFGSKIVSCKKK